MLQEQHIVYDNSENLNIHVYDGVFSLSEKLKMIDFSYHSFFNFGRKASVFPGDNSSLFQLQSTYSLSDIEQMGFFQNKNIETILRSHLNSSYCLERFKIIAVMPHDSFEYHTDSFEVGDFSLLYYMNLDWQPFWEGETNFGCPNLIDIFFSCAFVPGRVVIFDSSIPHKSTQQSFSCPHVRFVANAVFTKQKNNKLDVPIENLLRNK